MVIREKALVAQMKEAYKGGGYTVAAMHSGKTVILCNHWAAQIDDAEVPREALSLICLHMGFLPEDGDAFTVCKGKKEPIVTRERYANAVEKFDALEALLDKNPEDIEKTVLTYCGYSVWQSSADGHVHLVNPTYEQILYKIEGVRLAGNALYAADPLSKVFIACVDNKGSELVMEHLSKKLWKTVM